MNNTIKITLALSITCLGAFTSCKKNGPQAKSTSCTPVLYGYTMPAVFDTLNNCTGGTINTSSAAFSSIAAPAFVSSAYHNQAAFNLGDTCYYAFKVHMGKEYSVSPLYKISMGGSVTTLTTSGTDYYSSLTYNKITNQLVCFKNGQLAALAISGTSFSASVLVAPLNPISIYRNSLTVDNNTGDMFFVTGNTPTYYIERYIPGASATSVVATTSGAEILGIRYNESDNMLYGVRENNNGSAATTYDLIKIDPSLGSTTTLVSLGTGFNSDFYATCINPCNNRFIYSTYISSQAVLTQYTTSGTLLQSNNTATFYGGLDLEHM